MTKNKYKFGKSEIDLEQYINELGSNVDSYLESTGWGEEQKKQFRDAYNQYMEGFQAQNTSGGSRFYTNDFGDIYDTEGKLGSQDGNKVISFYYDNKGQRITPEEYNQLKDNKKKKYRAFSATSSFANYAKKVGKKLASSQSQESKESDNKFSFAKHGFLPTWQRELLPVGGEWDPQPFLDMDPADENGVRGTTGRAKNLANELKRYSEKLGDYDYSDTPYGTKEEFQKRIQEAIDFLQNGYDSSDTIALNKIGIGNEFLKGYFQTGQTKEPLTGIEREIEQLRKEKEEAEKQKKLEEEKYNLTRDQYFRNYNSQLQEPLKLMDIQTFNEENFNNDEKVKTSYIDSILNPLYREFSLHNLSPNDRKIELQKALTNYLPKLSAELRKSGTNIDMRSMNYLKAAGLMGILQPGDDNFATLPESVDLNRGSYLAYNPVSGIIEERRLNLMDQLQQRMAYDAYDKMQKKEQGGTISLQYGGYVIGDDYWKKKQQEWDQEADVYNKINETGKSEKEVRAENRKPLKQEELSGVDITRLTTAGLDIASMISSFVPGYGTIASAGLGLGSTVGNIGADIADDSMSAWDTTKNALFGLGMDVLGLIPGWGASAKATKIVRVLKPVAKTALAVMSGLGMVNSYNAFTKMISNPSEMTVADWRDALAGIKAITGAARSKGTTVSRNRERGRNQVASNYVNVPVKSGKSVKMSEEQFSRLKKAKGIEEQNKILKEVAPDEELGTEFISGKFNHLRHPLHRNPSVEKGTDYVQMDWSQMEYLPIGYTYDKASKQVVPKKWSNAWIMNKVDKMVSSNEDESGFSGWLREKNPLYNQQNTSNQTSQRTTKQTSQGANNQKRDAIDRAIENNPNFMWRKEGGILKFQDGGSWRTGYLTTKGTPENATNTNTWGDYYDFKKILEEVPDRVTQDADKFITSMNNLNKIEQDNKLGFGLNINERGYADWNKEFNNTGFNHFFQYNEGLNDYLGPSTYNRHQLIGKLQGIYSAENPLNINGQNVYYDGSQWVLAQPSTPGEVKPEAEQKPEQTSEVKPRITLSAENAVAKEAKQATSKGNGLSAFGALRLWLGNQANKRMTKLALDAQQPMYLNPVQAHRYVQSDLSAEMAGQDAMARLMNWSSKPMTSDISQNFAQQMDAMVKGLDYVNQGRRQSNATLREMAEKAWLQEQQNALNRYQIHNENLASAYKTMQNKSAIQQAFENKQFTNWDTFLKQMEYDKLVANREKRAKEDAMALEQFSDQVTNNLSAYDPKLSREAVQLYQDVQNGIRNVSSLTPEETQLFRQAAASAKKAMNELYTQRYGLARQYLEKKGGKLDHNKDLDRFYKYLDSVMNRNEKALDRVSKSMYALYKRKSK